MYGDICFNSGGIDKSLPKMNTTEKSLKRHLGTAKISTGIYKSNSN
jgi:hypothetical protein